MGLPLDGIVHERTDVSKGAPVVSLVCARPDSEKQLVKIKESKRTWVRTVVRVMVLDGFG